MVNILCSFDSKVSFVRHKKDTLLYSVCMNDHLYEELLFQRTYITRKNKCIWHRNAFKFENMTYQTVFLCMQLLYEMLLQNLYQIRI